MEKLNRIVEKMNDCCQWHMATHKALQCRYKELRRGGLNRSDAELTAAEV